MVWGGFLVLDGFVKARSASLIHSAIVAQALVSLIFAIIVQLVDDRGQCTCVSRIGG